MINLISNSNVVCKVDKTIIMSTSILLKDILEDDKNNECIFDIPIPFEDNIIKKIIDYCNYFYYVPSIYENDAEDDAEDIKTISNWYATFINVDDEMVFKLLRISDFLNIESLSELCSAKIITIIKDKTLNELNERFNTDMHCTREESEEFKSSYNWKFKV